MTILIDECLPRKLTRSFEDYEVSTVPQEGWAGKKNGELIQLMAGRFDVFITMDNNLEYQQYLVNLPLAFVVFSAPNNKLDTLLPLIPKAHAALKLIQPGQVIKIKV